MKLLGALVLCSLTVGAYAAQTKTVTVSVSVEQNGNASLESSSQLGAGNASSSTRIVGNLESNYVFPSITTDNYNTPSLMTAASPFAIYDMNNFTNNTRVSLVTGAGQSASNETYLVNSKGQTIPYVVEYDTCSNGSTQATVDLSSNAASSPITCSNHQCVIPNQFANKLTCYGGGDGQLKLIRLGLAAKPAPGTYSGQFKIVANPV